MSAEGSRDLAVNLIWCSLLDNGRSYDACGKAKSDENRLRKRCLVKISIMNNIKPFKQYYLIRDIIKNKSKTGVLLLKYL